MIGIIYLALKPYGPTLILKAGMKINTHLNVRITNLSLEFKILERFICLVKQMTTAWSVGNNATVFCRKESSMLIRFPALKVLPSNISPTFFLVYDPYCSDPPVDLFRKSPLITPNRMDAIHIILGVGVLK